MKFTSSNIHCHTLTVIYVREFIRLCGCMSEQCTREDTVSLFTESSLRELKGYLHILFTGETDGRNRLKYLKVPI